MKVNKAFYTYNTGTMLQSNVLLYQIIKDKKYLDEAQRIAMAGRDHFYKDGKLPSEYWFNAVMLRGYVELYNEDKNEDWINFFRDDAERVWKDERDEKNLLGKRLYKRLIDQAGLSQ